MREGKSKIRASPTLPKRAYCSEKVWRAALARLLQLADELLSPPATADKSSSLAACSTFPEQIVCVERGSKAQFFLYFHLWNHSNKLLDFSIHSFNLYRTPSSLSNLYFYISH